MTYGQVRLRVSQECPGFPNLDLLDGYLLDRYLSILDRLKWTRQAAEYSLVTVAGTALYALPGTIKIFSRASIPSEYIDLTRMSKAELDATAPGRPAGQSIPRIVALSLDSATDPPVMQVELYPPPDAVYTVLVEGTSEASAITGTAATVLPWLRPAALIAGATADAFAHLEKWSAADRMELKYEKYLGDMIRTECLNRGPQPLRLSSWMTRHNVVRAIRSSFRTGPRLP